MEKHLKTIRTVNVEETLSLGRKIGISVPEGSVIALKGGLGAGKTTLCKGIALGLGIEDTVTSPTYTIVSEYSGRLDLFHIDAYRLKGEGDFFEIGGYELLGAENSLCLIEWSERIPEIIDKDTAVIEIRVEEDGSRVFVIEGTWLEGVLG
jgi:tRNA threonylcarbamoyladenosine biosynthesis protein TsaE